MSGQLPVNPSIPPIAPNTQANVNRVATSAFNTFKSKANDYLISLDKELSKQPYCNDIERRTGVPKAHLAVSAGAAFFLLVFFNFGAKLLTNALSWVYPGKVLIYCVFPLGRD